MKIIKEDLFNRNMGILINVEEKSEFVNNKINGAINIPYDTLLYNYKTLLSKDKKYYIYCKKGIRSKKIVYFLESMGYNVTQLLRN